MASARRNDGFSDGERQHRFDMSRAEGLLDGFPRGALNIAYETVGRHVAAGRGDETAIRWLGKSGDRRDLTFDDLWSLSGQFANLLAAHGIAPGARVASLLGRTAELYAVALGSWRAGMVYSPLFAAFGPDPIRRRMTLGRAEVLVTTESLYLRKVAPWRNEVGTLKLVLLVGEEAHDDARLLGSELGRMAAEFETARTMPDTPAFVHFTSGTTGEAKGAVHVHGAALSHAITGRDVLGLGPGRIYWCTADPAWITGSAYGIIAPLLLRARMIVDEADFDPVRWLDILEAERVQSWYTTPVAIRVLMREPDALYQARDFRALERIASVGEPLPAEAPAWARRAFGQPIANTWWQTETGSIMLSDFRSPGDKPGALGRPVPGIEAAVVDRGESGVSELPDGEVGELALRAGWPSLMSGLLGEETLNDTSFSDGWYLSGDLAVRDGEGDFWFAGRATELVKTSGQMIGPHEVEAVLLEHPAVAEAAAIGRPDDAAGEVVVAYVVLAGEQVASAELGREILAHARRRMGPVVAPREIHFRASLPRTSTGKLMRRRLRGEAMGIRARETPAAF